MKAAVYNQYWHTGGGGETFCGGIAQVLAETGYEVTLLAQEAFDTERLGERLSVDLSGCTVEVVDAGPIAVSEASARFDLFVNGSYLSSARNRAPASVYVVHFPGHRPPRSRLEPVAAGLQKLGLRRATTFAWGEGFHAHDPGAAGAAWTSGRAELIVDASDDHPMDLELVFAHLWPRAAGPANVTVRVDGEPVTTLVVPPTSPGLAGRIGNRIGTSAPITIPGAAGTVKVTIESDVFVPADLGLGDDRRQLGVAFRGISGGPVLFKALSVLSPRINHLLATPSGGSAVSSYDVVASNSEFTRRFVEEWWDIEHSPVLYPPVVLRERAPAKGPCIVAVGRFFDQSSGHSKKQEELVRGFRRLRALGVDDWTLTFVGGCDRQARDYLDAVRTEAEGLPVEFMIDASGQERDEAIASASIFWHATGLGEDAHLHPDRMEHFGISTVEAMSTGAVPVVFAGGGQLEIVEDGISGFHFRTIDELVDRTRRLIDDPGLLARMGDAAASRASEYGLDRFRERLAEIVAMATGPDPAP